MKSMLSALVLFAVATAAQAAPRPASPYAGRYAEPGAWGFPSETSDIRISSNGSISGGTTIHFGPSEGAMDPVTQAKTEYRGDVTSTGAMTLTLRKSWTYSSGGKVQTVQTATGHVTRDADGDLFFTGVVTYASGVTAELTFVWLRV